MEETSAAEENTIQKSKKISCKNILIISLLPIPNILILYYYIICFKIIVESYQEECERLNNYNICSLVLIILFNIYIVSQLCVDSPRLFFKSETKLPVGEIFLMIFLSFSIFFGCYILKDEDRCEDIDKNVYTLSTANLILQAVIILILVIFWFYFACYAGNTRIHPKAQPQAV